ncbi:G5 domain-containing protein [Actinoplanes rectilineatus]|uniref:G5 domain-containing protein n=1 Tax=Actinoplanes rectilineatus TaxID=113571 RepID=UPI000A9B301C|nr:G5 domain-containing protein [Actinoplanes rectilineatus]
MPRKSWWARLPFGVRMTVGTTAILAVVGGGATGVAGLTGGGPEDPVAAAPSVADPVDVADPLLDDEAEVVSREAAAAEPLPRRHQRAPGAAGLAARSAADQLGRTSAAADQPAATSAGADRDGGDRAARTEPRSVRTPKKARTEPAGKKNRKAKADTKAKGKTTAEPVVTTRTETETRVIPFHTKLVRDSSLPRGVRRVQTPGKPGEERVRYLVTMTDGEQTDRRLLDTTVTRKPRHRVVVFGAQWAGDAKDCQRDLHVCVPVGRAALCPQDQDAVPVARPEPSGAVRGPESAGALLFSVEELELLGPGALDSLRREPASLC